MHQPVAIVGILNVTPDSYFDGGQFNAVDAALRKAGELLQEGADIIDIGGESTGPGSVDVSLDEELARTISVIEALQQEYPDSRLSIDTYKAEVASQALAAGASMVNDVTAGRAEPELLSVVAKHGAELVLMFSKDHTARTTVDEVQYEDVVAAITQFLTERVEAAQEAGVAIDKLILDPGMGHFISSEAQYSYEVLARLPELTALDCPLYLSPSRKSFLAGAENLPPNDRLSGTVAASAIAVLNGAHYIRTHDVLAVRRGCEVAQAVLGAQSRA